MKYDELAFDLEQYRIELWGRIILNFSDSDIESLNDLFIQVFQVEQYWAYPGRETLNKLKKYLDNENIEAFKLLSRNLYESLKSQSYRAQEFAPFNTNLSNLNKPQSNLLTTQLPSQNTSNNLKPYFEVLVVHPFLSTHEVLYRNSLANFKSPHDNFIYDVLFVDNYYDAIIAIISNSDIQACIYIDDIEFKKTKQYDFESSFNTFINDIDINKSTTINLKNNINCFRPEIDHYYLTEGFASEQHHKQFNRILYALNTNLFADIHSVIISGIEKRYSTPFFDALRSYAKRPKGSFHALPISQGQSIQSSYWISDVAKFYGEGIFSAETSSTLGGMDSIMEPKGSISQAQKKAAALFQSKKTYYVTNGTTTANKIVMQANLHPDDIVLLSSDCHKSIPYSILLSGATPIFLETYPLNKYDLYGCVTLKRIKQVLLDLKKNNNLHRVKQITLTNSTFDGIVYDVKRYMLDILSIKPDIIFHWDEAWFSFGYFNPLYQGKTAMSAANVLLEMKSDEAYREVYNNWKFAASQDTEYLLNNNLLPDPDLYKVRVYATQSIHKTLTAFRQATMLHTHDEMFSESNFYEAYRTHTSTSPNYQIIASLDFARRQMSLEGYKLIKNSIRLACKLRCEISHSAHLNKYFKVLNSSDLIPEEYRKSTSESNANKFHYSNYYQNHQDELFIVDPTRVTVDISETGIDGPNFRQMLMTEYDIQVNKTSHNTILFIVNIGVDENNIRYLLESLNHIANKLNNSENLVKNKKYIANLPLTRNYHQKFVTVQSGAENNFQAVNIRRAYYAGLKPENIDFAPLTNELMEQINNKLTLISAGFITPYPPGFPIIVPGQIITYEILRYLQNIQIKEIHGFNPQQGLKVFTQEYFTREG